MQRDYIARRKNLAAAGDRSAKQLVVGPGTGGGVTVSGSGVIRESTYDSVREAGPTSPFAALAILGRVGAVLIPVRASWQAFEIYCAAPWDRGKGPHRGYCSQRLSAG